MMQSIVSALAVAGWSVVIGVAQAATIVSVSPQGEVAQVGQLAPG